MPQLQNTYFDRILTDVSVRFSNDDFIAPRIFPTLPVEKKTGFYFTYDKSNLRRHKSLRTGRSYANEVDHQLEKTPYGPLQEHSLRGWIEQDVLTQYDDPYDPRRDTTESVTENLLIEREASLAGLLSDTDVVEQNNTLSGTDQWNNYENSNPFSDIETARTEIVKNGMKVPNTAVMSWEVWSKLRHHPDLLDRVKHSQLGVLTQDLLRDLIGVENIVIAKQRFNDAQEGGEDDMQYIWGKHFWLAYVSPQPALRTITAGYHLSLQDGREVLNWERDDGKGEWVQVTDYYEQKLVAPEAIYLVQNAVA